MIDQSNRAGNATGPVYMPTSGSTGSHVDLVGSSNSFTNTNGLDNSTLSGSTTPTPFAAAARQSSYPSYQSQAPFYGDIIANSVYNPVQTSTTGVPYGPGSTSPLSPSSMHHAAAAAAAHHYAAAVAYSSFSSYAQVANENIPLVSLQNPTGSSNGLHDLGQVNCIQDIHAN
jgi:hypothetical protein